MTFAIAPNAFSIAAAMRFPDPLLRGTLIKRYKRPEKPEDHVGYLVAGLCADRLTDGAHDPAWAKWLEAVAPAAFHDNTYERVRTTLDLLKRQRTAGEE